MTSPIIRKLGTVDCDIVEANPIVWKGRLLRLEYIRWKRTDMHYYGNYTGKSYHRFVDHLTGEIVVDRIAEELHMGNAFIWEDKVIITAVEDWGKSRFYQLESTDLEHWTAPRVILEDKSWEGYNTTICRAGNRFVMGFELGAPLELVHTPFTCFFAESTDLQNWTVIPGASGFKDIYTGGFSLHYVDDFFYLFYLDGDYTNGFRTCVARSKDLISWKNSSRNPILDYGEEDRKLLGEFTPTLKQKIRTAVNINASDMDFCEYQGKVHIIYSWGNQRGTEILARAESDLSEAAFCKYFFE